VIVLAKIFSSASQNFYIIQTMYAISSELHQVYSTDISLRRQNLCLISSKAPSVAETKNGTNAAPYLQLSISTDIYQDKTLPEAPPRYPSPTRSLVHPTSHKSQSTIKNRPYCTHNCIHGLVYKGPLDPTCPNVEEHGNGSHQLDDITFLKSMQAQFARDLDSNILRVGLPRLASILYKVREASKGYTVVAKFFPDDQWARAEREADIYDRLSSIQGIHVPVHIGNIELKVPLLTEIVQLEHVVFLSFGGTAIDQHLSTDQHLLTDQAVKAMEPCTVYSAPSY
jgi:hypothetical protein